MAYQRPMVTVEQNMTIAPTSIERDQPAFIFGENYELHRYEDSGEKENTKAEQRYDLAKLPKGGLQLPFPKAVDESAIDTRYTKLFGDNVEVALTGVISATYCDDEFNTGLSSIQCGKVILGVDGDEKKLLKRKIRVGSALRVVVNGYESLTKVIGCVWDAADEDNNGEGIYIQDQFEYDHGGSSSGEDEGVEAEVRAVDFVDGVEFSRKNPKYHDAADRWQWEQLPVVDIHKDEHDIGVVVYRLWASIRYDWDDADGDYYEVLSADLYITFRELVTSYADTIHSLVGASEVANVLGAVSPDNPLAMGVYMACLNAATDSGLEAPPVYFMAVGVDENGKPDYAEVLNRASLTDRVYVLAPTTRDEAVLEMVRSHVEAMSVKTVKQWRIAAASADIDRGKYVLSKEMDPQADEYYAVVEVPEVGQVCRIKAVAGKEDFSPSKDTSFRSTVVVGDTVKLNQHPNIWGEAEWDEFIVKRVVNNYLLEATPVDPSVLGYYQGDEVAVPISIWHEYTAAETADVVASLSRAMASRRMLNVFPSVFISNGVTMTGEFAACAVAGLVSATEPQQPITNVTIRGIDDIPLIYGRYNKADLDLMASGGTFIVCQDLPGDVVYVRHQITTAYPEGNINTAELSITKNVDDISYKFADVYRPYYGKYNITPELLAKFKFIANTLLSSLGKGSGTYGPQVIMDNTEVLYVRQNEVMKDHVDIGIRLGVPYPCNNIDIVLTV